MSYILDALRKSESERRQGRVPDLGQQVQLIHKPKKKSSIVLVWVGLGLVLNAAVLAYVFWPDSVDKNSEPVAVASPSKEQSSSEESRPEGTQELDQESARGNDEVAVSEVSADAPSSAGSSSELANEEVQAEERPTIIVPSQKRSQPTSTTNSQSVAPDSVPHLVELPLEFQKSVPDLVFNSHIYASAPSSRRVMINNQYLKAGDTFSGIRVDQITEEGVVLSKNGRQFRVGSVRDWVSPD